MAHDLIEEIRVTGEELIDKVRELLKEGNIRRIVIQNSKGDTVIKLPLAIGIIGAGGAFALAPVLTSIATFALLAKDTHILVERYPASKNRKMKNKMPRDKTASNAAGYEHNTDPYEIDAEFEVLD